MAQLRGIFDAFLADDDKNVAYLLAALKGHEGLLSSLPNMGAVVSDFSSNIKKIKDSHDSFLVGEGTTGLQTGTTGLQTGITGLQTGLAIRTLEKLEKEKRAVSEIVDLE